jgi:DNA-binding NarL/FixJ family response regulator
VKNINTLMLVEDHTLVRSGIASLLRGAADFKVIGEAGEGRDALAMFEKLRPDFVLMDVQMKSLNGIEAARRIRATSDDVKIVMLSMHGDAQYVFESLKAGANGYVLKDAAFTELLTALRTVAGGRRYLSPPLADLVMDDYVRRATGKAAETALDKLTSREREVLQLVTEGRSSAEVAKLMHVSIRTVETHRYNVMQKLSIHSIAELTKFAIAHGLTSLK